MSQSWADYDEIQARIVYNPITGQFTRIVDGKVLGVNNKQKYLRISICGKSYYAHRLAFLLMTGRWPKEHMDHINRDTRDNRWSNLRECTSSQNNHNVGAKQKKYDLPKGVTFRRKSKIRPYRAMITLNGKIYRRGPFATIDEAKRAYDDMALEFFGEYASV